MAIATSLASVPVQVKTIRSREGSCLAIENALVQVAAVHVEGRRLLPHRFDHVRVGMPDAGHVVVHVDVALAVRVEQEHALAANDVQRLFVEERRTHPEHALPPRDQVRRDVSHAPSRRGPATPPASMKLMSRSYSGVRPLAPIRTCRVGYSGVRPLAPIRTCRVGWDPRNENDLSRRQKVLDRF
jgi:hypothetical protein